MFEHDIRKSQPYGRQKMITDPHRKKREQSPSHPP
jgi:hypothetical protein